ncbi:coilin isoform X2 [Arachis ipaensis]|uniref:coilin n=1 Tax=Arachis hypogaea TaxID=3818 RepID=UPI0007AFA804|nr:coilin isoform X2 [Arachis ipaensis]XP_025682716.1 coilin [Arachis hypogaea]QHN81559.1 Coilin [Arachis hypogaea]
MTAEMVRVRVVFEEGHMLSKSKKKEGLKRCWLLLKPQYKTISDLSSHLQNAFKLHRTCPNGITLYMDGFVLPPFESTSILKDKDIICVKRKGSMLIDKPDTPISAHNGHQSIELAKLLAIEGPQDKEAGRHETDSEEDGSGQFGDTIYAEPEIDGNVISKKRKASKKLKSPSQKKMKLSSPDKLTVTEVHEEEKENGTPTHNKLSLSKKENDKSSNLSSQKKKSKNLKSHKQSNDKSEPMHDEKRLPQPQGDGGSGTKKTPSRSARRKKAKRKWLREQLKSEKEKLHQSPAVEKDVQKLPAKNNIRSVANAPQSDEESEAEDDIVPVEIRPGHIRFQSLKKDQEAPQNQIPVETSQWNGITSKKKGQKWGKESTWPHKQDAYAHSSQDYHTVQNVEKKHASKAIDFDKLTPYTSLPKEGDVIAYRLIELSSSWTPELSSFRVGRITKYNAKSNRVSLEPVSEYPFEFKKKIDDDASSVQFDPSPYGEDGSLEIDYLSLAEVRMVSHGNNLNSSAIAVSNNDWDHLTKPSNGSINKKCSGDQTAVGSSEPVNGGHTSAKENGAVNVWDEINEALTAKKTKLSQANCWRKEESSSSQSWSQRALRCSALGPTMALLRSQNGLN